MKHLTILAFGVLLLGAGCTTSATVSETADDLDTEKETTTTTTETVRTKTIVTDEDGDTRATADITADVTTTVDCGADKSCFDDKFAACEPATLVGDFGPASFSYEIIAAATDGCKVTMQYPKNPNPAWVNQPMTCTLDNTLELTAAASKQFEILGTSASTCTGPLAALMK